MPLKLPATTAKLLETGGQSKPQPGLPQQPVQLSIPGDPALCSRGAQGASFSTGIEGRGARFLHQSLGAAGQRGRPWGLTTASQGEAGLGADGTCSAGERAFLLFMLSGGNASQAFRMAL